jgi:signal transduction histidine kinase
MFIGTAIDVTETKRAQDALRETQSKLERVTRLTTMHTVTASIAHEVNQPLAAIVANGKAALRWLRRSPPEIAEAVANVNQIISGGYRSQPAFLSLGGARAGVSLKPVQQFGCPFRFLVLCFEHAG